MRIDLNADLGEGVGDDEALLAVVSSANIAHPSYRDWTGFGRASGLGVLRTSRDHRRDFVDDLVSQVLGVARAAEGRGTALAHVKAHGALYNEAVVDDVAARVVVDAVASVAAACGYPVAVLTLPGGVLGRIAGEAGLPVLAEGFVDRAYRASGGLVPRREPGALLADESAMVAQALQLASGHVRPVDGPMIDVRVDSLCVHGDTPGAVGAARSVRAALERGGWRVAAPGAGS